VLLGDTSGIEEGLFENIRRGGIAHIFAVSGLHVGSLFGACLLLLKKTSLRRLSAWVHFTLIVSVLFVYAGVCAFSPSVVRATIICIVAYLGVLLQVKTDFLQSLGIAATCIMLFDPSALFTAGFQFSFAACFGIALLSKPIGQVFDELAKLYRKRFPKPLTEAEVEAIKNGDTLPPSIPARIYRACASFLSTSLAAQIFTAPLLLLYFGYISGWALLLNCFFVPFIGAVFSLLLLSVGAACVLPMIAKAFLYIPNLIWSAVLLLFELVDFTKFAIEGISISATMIAIYLTSTLFFTDKWNLKKSARWILGGVCIFAFGVGMVALNV
jgi:competence protein ComEC